MKHMLFVLLAALYCVQLSSRPTLSRSLARVAQADGVAQADAALAGVAQASACGVCAGFLPFGQTSPRPAQGGPARVSPRAARCVAQASARVELGATLLLVQGEEQAVRGQRLARQGDIYIVRATDADIAAMAADDRLTRLERGTRPYSTTNDITATIIGADKVWGYGSEVSEGRSGGRAGYTGRGVVVGVVDCGINYRHPAFRSTQDGRLRIVRAWDMLAPYDPAQPDARFPWGRLYTDSTAILAAGASRDVVVDSIRLTHGTHTTATAAGSGWGTPYRGIAPEADIYSVCLPLTDNAALASDSLQAVGTAATLLAFQRIYEYADSVGMPCVVSCSFGQAQDMTDEDALYNAFLARLLATPGHAFVAAAGNNGKRRGYVPITERHTDCGTITADDKQSLTINVSAAGDVPPSARAGALPPSARPHIVCARGEGATCPARAEGGTSPATSSAFCTSAKAITPPLSLTISSGTQSATIPLTVADNEWVLAQAAIPELPGLMVSVYSGTEGLTDGTRHGWDVFLMRDDQLFNDQRYTLSLDCPVARQARLFVQDGECSGGEACGNLSSPAALPCAIAVGNTVGRASFVNVAGQTQYGYRVSAADIGCLNPYSSTGPSLHGLDKPEVCAPGTVTLSAYANTDKATDIAAYTDYGGVRYAYGCMSGTSMSTPAVAGAVALLLEARPALTQDELRRALADTTPAGALDISVPAALQYLGATLPPTAIDRTGTMGDGWPAGPQGHSSLLTPHPSPYYTPAALRTTPQAQGVVITQGRKHIR